MFLKTLRNALLPVVSDIRRTFLGNLDLAKLFPGLAGGRDAASAATGDSGYRKSFPKHKPVTRHVYLPVDDDSELTQYFSRLARGILDPVAATPTVRARHVGPSRPPAPRFVVRETGRLDMNRPYFYVKTAGGSGWLFERSGGGWSVGRAHKLVNNGTFVRTGELWDSVMLFQSPDADSGTLPRVWSRRFSESAPQPWSRSGVVGEDRHGYLGASLMPLGVYEQKLAEAMIEE